jgi:hypothetical protein
MNETGPDKIRAAIERDRGMRAPDLPITLCGGPVPETARDRLADLARRTCCRVIGHKPFYPDPHIAGLTARPFCDRCDVDLDWSK